MARDARPLILAIDDDPITLNLAVAILKNYYRLRPFTVPEMAFKYLSRSDAEVHLALLDYHMPLMSGPEVFKCLRSYSLMSGVPVIFMTGLTDKAAEEELLASGATGIIHKPPTAVDLLGKIKDILGQY